MVKLTVLYGQPKDPAAFEDYYLKVHTPIALKIKGVRRFEIARAMATPGGGSVPYYRTADVYFDDLGALQEALASPEGQAAAADIANFATGGATLLIVDCQVLSSR